jgi:transcriptional regulator
MKLDSIKFLSAGKFSTDSNIWIHPKVNSAFDELIYVTKGTLRICEDYSEYSVTENSAIWLQSGHLHYGTNATGKPLSFIRVIFSSSPDNNVKSDACIHFRKLSRLKNQAKFVALCHFLAESSNDPKYPSYFNDYIVRLLLTELALQSTEYDGTVNIQQTISNWIKNDAPSGIKVNDVAKHFGYSEDHITRIFKSFYSKGLKSYIDEIRIGRIKHELLESNRPLSDISEKNGFTNINAFYKFFKSNTGMTVRSFLSLYK